MKTVKKNDRIALYYQLMDIVIEQIETGFFEENDKIPSEREFCEQHKISRATVKQAMQNLEKEGYIYRQHGRGTFVSPARLKQDLLKFYSFTEEMKKKGKIPTSKVLDFEVVECDSKIAKKMQEKIGEKLYKFTRVRLADNEPMMLETSYLSYKKFPDLKRADLEEKALYEILIKKFHIVFTLAEESFQPVLTRENEAKLFGIKKNSPSMLIERKAYEKETIIEYTKGIARGDRFIYNVILKKHNGFYKASLA